MSEAIKNMEMAVQMALTDLEDLFTPGVKLTFLARFPDNDEADVMVSSDSIDGIAAMIDRMRARDRAAEIGKQCDKEGREHAN